MALDDETADHMVLPYFGPKTAGQASAQMLLEIVHPPYNLSQFVDIKVPVACSVNDPSGFCN